MADNRIRRVDNRLEAQAYAHMAEARNMLALLVPQISLYITTTQFQAGSFGQFAPKLSALTFQFDKLGLLWDDLYASMKSVANASQMMENITVLNSHFNNIWPALYRVIFDLRDLSQIENLPEAGLQLVQISKTAGYYLRYILAKIHYEEGLNILAQLGWNLEQSRQDNYELFGNSIVINQPRVEHPFSQNKNTKGLALAFQYT